MMNDEVMGSRSAQTLGGSPISFYIYVDDADAAFKKTIAAGAKQEFPITEMFWGDKMGKVWSWKNELPARFPDLIFYGKRSSGTAMLCSMEALKDLYARQHRPLDSLSVTAQRLYSYISQDPINNAELKQLTGLTGKSSKAAYDRALQELQVTFNIVRVNRTDTDGDTWTPFTAQYPDFDLRGHA